MKIEKIGTGSSISEAYENAKMLLAAPDDAELHQEIIQDVKKRFLGLKIEPAKVKVWYEIPDKKEPAPVKEKPVQKPVVKKQEPKVQAPKKETVVEKKEPAKKAAAQAPAEAAAEKTPAVKTENFVNEEIKDSDYAAKYLRLIVEGMGIENYSLTLQRNTDTDEYVYRIECDEDGTIIGRRGETLDSIQYLLRLAINKGVEEDKHRKVSVNVGNYREKRNENLRALAARSAKQVLKYGRNVVLDPMNPYERRIIHTAIQEIEGVTSHSTGVDAGRKVVISLEEGVQPTHPSKGGYNNRGGRRDNRRGGGRGGYQKREPYKPAQTREPRKDAVGSLYGKIEIPAKNEEE